MSRLSLLQISLPFFYVSVLFVLFAMITYSVGAYVISVSKAHLKDEEPSFRVVQGFYGNYCK